jgi:succinoglycan biosynthesis transport protein ExoP
MAYAAIRIAAGVASGETGSMMSALWYRNLIRRFWWLLLLCVLFGATGGFAGGRLVFPVYQATARLQANIRAASPSSNVVLANDRVIRTLALNATSSAVLDPVAAKYGISEGHLTAEASSVAVANTSELTITVQDADPERAATLANAIAAEVIAQWQASLDQQNAASQQSVRSDITTTSARIVDYTLALQALGNPPSNPARAASLETQIKALQQQYQQDLQTLSHIQTSEATNPFLVTFAAHAAPPSSPLISRLAVDAGAGGLFAAFIGLILIAGFSLTQRRLRSAEGVASASGWPVLVEFERVKTIRPSLEGMQITDDTLGNAAAALVQSIEFLSVDRPLRVIVVTGPSPSGLSSAIASSLALYLSAGGRRTLLVDARFQTGAQARQFGVPLAPGLSNATLAARGASSGTFKIEGVLYEPTQVHAPLLRVLPAGSPPPNPGRLLASRPMSTVLSWVMATEAEVIVIDAPPLVSATQVSALAEVVDGFLPVVDLRDSTVEQLLKLQTSLADAGATVLGCVVNRGRPGGRSSKKISRAEVSADGAGANMESSIFAPGYVDPAPNALREVHDSAWEAGR